MKAEVDLDYAMKRRKTFRPVFQKRAKERSGAKGKSKGFCNGSASLTYLVTLKTRRRRRARRPERPKEPPRSRKLTQKTSKMEPVMTAQSKRLKADEK